MKQWIRAKVEANCGLCHERIYKQQPMLAIQVTGMRRVLYRCADCAGPAPPDLPEVVELQEPEKTPLRPLRTMAKDVESILSGWRDRYGESR